MKLQQLLEYAELNQVEDALDQMADAYDELALLSEAFRKKDFGILINKHGGNLTRLDIREISRKLTDIVRNNVILDGGEFNRGRDGHEKLRLLARSIGQGIRVTALTVVTGALGALTVGTSVSMPIVAYMAGTATVGSAALTISHANMLNSLRLTSRLLTTLDAYENLKPRYNRSKFRRFLDWITRKSKDDIEKEVLKKIKKASVKAQRKFEKHMRGFPLYVEYTDTNGVLRKYPTAEFFRDL